MDRLPIARVFRRLFSHEICSRVSHQRALSSYAIKGPLRQLRSVSTGKNPNGDSTRESNWRPRTDVLPQDKAKDFERYPMVTADSLRTRKERPTRVKMLTRDFIDDSLYNPNYGYFSKQAIIFNSGEPFDFHNISDELEFNRILGQRYADFEDRLDAKATDDTRQLWHTPTELFRPCYGEAIARYLVENYKLSYHPFNDLIIYEMGAGNGTLMLNILDYIRDFYPDVYDCTKYKVIEISSALAKLQMSQISRSASAQGHAQHVEIINRSIFDWGNYVPEPCYILALEVIDNFGHDSIRYDPFSEEPMQGNVLIDNAGEFHEFYSSEIDPVAARYLHVRAAACSEPFQYPLSGSRALRHLKARLPLTPSFTVPEYIPTRLMQFFDVLHEYFPRHRLLLSDFHYLPNAIKGFNAPVVQTRYKRRVVPVTTPLVKQGYFDILFPTDFVVMEDFYRAITGNFTRLSTHEGFFRRWSYVEETQTRNGENPMLSWYKNASVMTTV